MAKKQAVVASKSCQQAAGCSKEEGEASKWWLLTVVAASKRLQQASGSSKQAVESVKWLDKVSGGSKQ